MTTFRQSHIIRNLRLRAAVIRAVRDFFHENAFLEVETPLRIPAPASEPHIHAFSTDKWYLQTSPELCMKRLLRRIPENFPDLQMFPPKGEGPAASGRIYHAGVV